MSAKDMEDVSTPALAAELHRRLMNAGCGCSHKGGPAPLDLRVIIIAGFGILIFLLLNQKIF